MATLMIANTLLEQSSMTSRMADIPPGQPFWSDDSQVQELQDAGMATLAPSGTIAPHAEPVFTVNGVPGIGACTSNCSR